MLRIVIADDHQMVREGVKGALQDLDPEIDILEAEDFDGIKSVLSAQSEIDLVLLDLMMPGMAGVTSLKELKQAFPDVPIAILSAHNDRKLIHETLENGADGYITKSLRKEVMLNAIRLILAGEIYLPSVLLEENNSLSGTGRSERPRHSQLTERQKEVYQLMKQGLSNKEIAREIGCVEGTVKAHVTSILKALSVNSRAKAIALDLDG